MQKTEGTSVNYVIKGNKQYIRCRVTYCRKRAENRYECLYEWTQTVLLEKPKRYTILPPLEERILPNLETVITGAEMIGTVRHSPGKVELQEGYDWTSGGQILFTPATDNAWLEADIDIEKEEYRGLILKMSHDSNYGKYKLFVDRKPIARVPMTIDFNNKGTEDEPKVLNLFSETLDVYDYYLGSTTLKKGKHTICFEQAGKDTGSTGNVLGFDSFRLMQRWNKKRVSLK